MKECYNIYCNRVIEEPFLDNGCSELCKECFRKFDNQKMRGRLSGLLSKDAQNELSELFEKEDIAIWDTRDSFNENRYTENINEWITWQKPTNLH